MLPSRTVRSGRLRAWHKGVIQTGPNATRDPIALGYKGRVPRARFSGSPLCTRIPTGALADDKVSPSQLPVGSAVAIAVALIICGMPSTLLAALCPVGDSRDFTVVQVECSYVQTSRLLYGTYEPSAAHTERIQRFMLAMGFKEQLDSAGTPLLAAPTFQVWRETSSGNEGRRATIQFIVRDGDEELWYSVLRDSNLFIDLGSSPLQLAMSTSDVVVTDGSRPRLGMQANPTSSVRLRTGRVSIKDVENWLVKQFKGKATLSLLENAEPRLEAELTEMRGQIFANDNFWEAAKMQVVKVDSEDHATFYFVLSARYAPGIGASRPSEQRYRSTTPDQESEVRRFLGRMGTSLKNDLESGK